MTDTGPRATGIVQFGDSFGAGFGTGHTTVDKCSLGQFSYGALLANDFAVPVGKFQRRECSGAVVIDVAQNTGSEDGQIDKWDNVETADVVALSVGGNDLGFADIVDGCFLRVWGSAPDCQGAIDTANDKIQNGTLQSFIETSLVQIINKSKNTDLKVYLTGYPAFFNEDTEYCNQVSFHIWNSGHTLPPFQPCDPKGFPCLTQDLRRTVNQLSANVNNMLSAAVDRVTSEKGANAVKFINPNASFNGHRFCESPNGKDVHEPDPSGSDTWFFLSNWPDNKLDNTLADLEDDFDPTLGNANTNTTAIPPSASVCDGSVMSENYMLCQMALVNEDVTSPEHAFLVEQQDEIRNGNFSASHLRWWGHAGLAKTFHPRTLGQNAYAELIKADLESRKR